MKFSVIMPVYNAARHLREAVDSVLNQTYSDWELVCVDDGSTDGSAVILEEYAKLDCRVRVFHQENAGVALARNRGLDEARGEWIAWIDADDVYATWRLAEIAEVVNRYNPDLVRTDMIMGTDANVRDFARGEYQVFEGDEAWNWAWNTLVVWCMLWMFVCKREFYASNRCIPGMRIKEEFTICVRIAAQVKKIVQSRSKSYFYRQCESSAMKSPRRAKDCLNVLDSVDQLWKTGLFREEICRIRFRRQCEYDIIDWVRMNDGDVSSIESIHKKYLSLWGEGVFDCPNWLQHRFKMPMWWFRLTGCIGLIALICKIRRPRFLKRAGFSHGNN